MRARPGRRGHGACPGTQGREYRAGHRRGLCADGAAQERRRADHPARLRENLDRGRHPALSLEEDRLEVRQARLGRDPRAAGLQAVAADQHDHGPGTEGLPGAIVGKGFGKAVVNFPDQAPIPASSPLTLFNGPPKNGNPTVFAHAYLTVGGPSTFVVPITIQKVHDGRYGFKTEAEIPKIVNGYGTPLYGRLTIGRTWTYKGKKLSYANAHCADGRLQAEGQFTFKDGTYLQGSLFKPCQIKK